MYIFGWVFDKRQRVTFPNQRQSFTGSGKTFPYFDFGFKLKKRPFLGHLILRSMKVKLWIWPSVPATIILAMMFTVSFFAVNWHAVADTLSDFWWYLYFCVFVNLQICVLSDSVFLLGRLTKQPRASSTGECEGEIQGNSCCVTGAGEGGSSYCHTGRRPWTQGWKIFATLTLDWKWTPSFLGYWRSKVSLGGRITMKLSHIETAKGLEKQSCGYMRWQPPMPGSGRDF